MKFPLKWYTTWLGFEEEKVSPISSVRFCPAKYGLQKVLDFLKLPKVRKMALRLKMLLRIQWTEFSKKIAFILDV